MLDERQHAACGVHLGEKSLDVFVGHRRRLLNYLRKRDVKRYRDLYRTYGPRSFRYAEMVFGNTATVARIRAEVPQERIHAMRTRKLIPMGEITRRTKLTAKEVQRFNPALLRSVPPNSTLYLPEPVPEFGDDVAFWHRPANEAFSAAMEEFLQLQPGAERWLDASFEPTLQASRQRFQATGTEEGQSSVILTKDLIKQEGRDNSGRRNDNFG